MQPTGTSTIVVEVTEDEDGTLDPAEFTNNREAGKRKIKKTVTLNGKDISLYTKESDTKLVDGEYEFSVEGQGTASDTSKTVKITIEKGAVKSATVDDEEAEIDEDGYAVAFEAFAYQKSGYEDVLFGKHLKHSNAAILHIDNPVTMTEFETNPDYVLKTERNLRTLYQFRSDLRGYSRLLTLVSGIHISAILWLMRLWHRMFGAIERRNLCGSRPYLLFFKLYRLGYYLSLTR